MRKSGSDTPKETPEEELKRLRKENARLKSQKEADKAKISDLKKELKKKDVPTITVSEEQRKLLSSLFPGHRFSIQLINAFCVLIFM